MDKSKLKRIIGRRLLVLDGATGTELQDRGMPAGVCPESWCLDNPGKISDVHAAYSRAGADIVYTCTFGANRLKLREFGVTDVIGTNKKLAKLARAAVAKRTLIAGDIGPTGKFVQPFGDLDFEEAVSIFREQAHGLLAGGVDLFVIETMMDIQEARAALIAVRELSDLFVIVTMTFEKNGRTLSGADPVSALVTQQGLGADAVGCNCSTGPEEMLAFISAMKPCATVPLVAKPNAGLPRMAGGKTVFDMDAQTFGNRGRQLAAAGANLLGGCCGTTPAHIASLRDEIDGAAPVAPVRKSVGALSSARSALLIEKPGPLVIVGERINPTGKKQLREALESGSPEAVSLIRTMALEQERRGADLLDVNIGVPGIDEPAVMKEVIGAVSVASGLPLVIDSPRIETIEAALRFYPGRCLINSISGERDKLEKLLPVAARYGAMFILLPITEGEVPETAARRWEIIRDIFARAREYGFTRDDILVDGLTMAIASQGPAAIEALKTVERCGSAGFMSILGLSNISFGMPGRPWINSAFLAMAAAAGLRAAIVNPSSDELMRITKAADVLLGRDRNASRFIAYFSEKEKEKAETREPLSPREKITRAVLDGDRDGISGLLEEAVAGGEDPFTLIQEVMIPAIKKVGELYDSKRYFLPQLIAGAEAMRKGMETLAPRLKGAEAYSEKGSLILATVEGDIHDIGKNIVSLIVSNHGYRVIDLGKSVSAEKIIEEAKRSRVQVIGLSALMTTTMGRMKECMEKARQAGLACPFLLGGAVVDRSYAEGLGAEYAGDGIEAVRVLDRIILSQKNHG